MEQVSPGTVLRQVGQGRGLQERCGGSGLSPPAAFLWASCESWFVSTETLGICNALFASSYYPREANVLLVNVMVRGQSGLEYFQCFLFLPPCSFIPLNSPAFPQQHLSSRMA